MNTLLGLMSYMGAIAFIIFILMLICSLGREIVWGLTLTFLACCIVVFIAACLNAWVSPCRVGMPLGGVEWLLCRSY